MSRWARSLALATGLVVLADRAADACKCGPDRTVGEAIEIADAVLVGTLVDQAFLRW